MAAPPSSAMGLPKASSAELPLLGAFEWHFSWARFLKFVGPGLLMSIAYIDPGNLGGDLQGGGGGWGWVGAGVGRTERGVGKGAPLGWA